MFFSLTNSPATFQSLMNTIFANLIVEGKVAIYFNDILIWNNDINKYRKVVKEVLSHLQEHILYLRLKKCKFEKSEIEYLSLIICNEEVAMDPSKIKAITNWPTPKTSKELRDFLDFANFYCRFIKDFSKTACPLHDLTKKDTPFVMGADQIKAFEYLKAQFTSEPVLAMWDSDCSTCLEVDTSSFATGRVIS